MLIIGELINGMYKVVADAIASRDAELIQHLAEDQVKAGAAALDVNTGPYSKNPKDDMKWLVEAIQKKMEVPLSIDSPRSDVLEEGIKLCVKRAIINSTSADDEKMDKVFGLASQYKARVIGLTMDKTGVPNNKERRIELAAKLVAKAVDSGMNAGDLLLDPIVLPLNVAQAQCHDVLEAIGEFRLLSDPAPKTVIGLSNISQGSKKRSLINRTYLVMALAKGLDAAILDPLDSNLIDAMITSELISNRNIYCDSFLEAYRRK